ncbi:MAG: cell division protein ZapA [Deltaproteobacteria bacterium]|nr:cell division protein ZapA [Deltaproteobacteria bacterium]
MKNHKIELGGKGFMIRSDVEEDRIRSIETFLNEKLDGVTGKSQRISFTDSLVLVLFHVADLMMDGDDSTKKVKTDAAGEVRGLRSEIDEIQQLVQKRLESTEDSIS